MVVTRTKSSRISSRWIILLPFLERRPVMRSVVIGGDASEGSCLPCWRQRTVTRLG